MSLFIFFALNSEAQFIKKLTKHANDKIEKEAQKRAERKIDKEIDAGFDEMEDALNGETDTKEDQNSTKENKQSSDNQVSEKENASPTSGTITPDSKIEETEQEPAKPVIVWNKFDFVPGDVVFFEDAPDANEENGEFPSRWDLYEGSCEIGEMDGEPVIMFLGGGSIMPYLENSDEDYLPEVFTIELDVYFEPGYHSNRYWITFQDSKNQWGKGLNKSMEIYVNGIDFMDTDKRYPGTESYNWGNNPEGGWKHISIAYTKGKFKAYMDDTRLINIPHLEGNPWGITVRAENGGMFIKNVRIAEGGVKYYDRVLTDGKIIVNGIKFDSNKATLKPESMGPINKIYKLMQDNPDLNFTVEGHTDSDGDEALNQTLSEERAKTVMNQLITMGIDPSRLKSAGWGESKPIDNNTTPEGKANNRRVEFVKF